MNLTALLARTRPQAAPSPVAVVAPSPTTATPLYRTDDLEILDYGLEHVTAQGAQTDRVDYEWCHVREWEAGHCYDEYQVAILRLVRFIPQEYRRDPAYLDKMRTVLTGLYNQRRARFDVVQILAGIWEPRPLGIVQIYGITARGSTLDAARSQARLGAAALEGALANFVQSLVEPLPGEIAAWLVQAHAHLPHISVTIGHPDRRMNLKGQGREGPAETPQGAAAEPDVTGQQLEMFARAMAKKRHPFVASLIASPVPTKELSYLLLGTASEASVVASLQRGTDSVSAGVALPLQLSANLGRSLTSAFGRTRGKMTGRSLTLTDGRAQTEGLAHSRSHSVTEGWAHTQGVAATSGTTASTTIARSTGSAETQGTTHTEGAATTEGSAHTVGTAHTQGASHTSGAAVTTSSNWAAGGSRSVNVGVSRGASSSQAHTAGTSQGTTSAQGATVSEGTHQSLNASVGTSASATVGGSVAPAGVGLTGSVTGGVTASVGGSVGQSQGTTNSSTTGTSSGTSASQTAGSGQSTGMSAGMSSSSNWSHGGGTTVAHSSSSTHSSATTNSEAHTTSRSQTASESNAVSQANTHSRGTSISHSVGHMHSTTHSSSDTVSGSETITTGTTRSSSTTTSTGTSRGISTSASESLTSNRSLGLAEGYGMGLGAIPSFSISRGYQWEDDQALQLTAVLRTQEELLRRATLEGAYLTDFYVLTATEEGAATADAALRQAFQGGDWQDELVVTPVQTRCLSPEEEAYIRVHARALVPSTRREPHAVTGEPYRDATLLTPSQLAAYTSPALFEEGLATTMPERIPPFAFYPDLRGDVKWAYLYSTETAQLTPTPVLLSRERFMHTLFAGDTGYGKSVAAERLLLETTRRWQTQSIVLDFGAGWRKLLNAPGLADHVEVWQLQPGARYPLRWNPWQVATRIRPERQLLATCEIFKNSGRMGERQLGYMRRAAHQMWEEQGVLTFSQSIQRDRHWGYVQDAEWAVLRAVWAAHRLPARPPVRRLPLRDLTEPELQALAVFRSRSTGLPRWLALLREQLGAKKANPAEQTSLEGLLLRLEAFTMGGMEELYGPGPDVIPIETLGLLGTGAPRWGLSILEGGAELDDYTKSVLMGLIAWHLYHDAVVRRREGINLRRDARITQIVFEEANKVLSGVDVGMSDGTGSQAATAALYQSMWRDGRKNHIYLHALVQTPSELAPGIVSSSNNIVAAQLKSPQDRDVIQAALAWSERGFTDEDYKRWLSRMPVALAVMKLGYSQDPTRTFPMLARPIHVDLPEPTDSEIAATMQRLAARRQGGLPC